MKGPLRSLKRCEQTPLHSIWKAVRGPFRTIHCTEHKWERYDVNHAGCLTCGELHRCSGNTLQGSTCPFVTLDDGAVVCPITGLCIPVVRCGKEFSVQPLDTPHIPPRIPGLQFHSRVQHTVDQTIYSHLVRQEQVRIIDRQLQLAKALFIKFVKQFKTDSAKNAGKTICIPTAVAYILQALKLHPIRPPPPTLGVRCSTVLTSCIIDLIASSPPLASNRVKLQSGPFIVGLLYLMKQGLVFNNTQWLPKVQLLNECLPPENQLQTMFSISTKTICETENEVKRILRHRMRVK